MGYHHLTRNERGKIALFYQNRIPIREIARRLHRSPATISRELRRNSTEGKYQSDKAQASYLEHRLNSRRRSLYEQLSIREYVSEKLIQTWSPEQIAGRLSSGLEETGFTVSCASIYRWLKRGLLPRSVQLRKNLRHYGHKYAEKRGAKTNARDISTRAREVFRRKRFGDWEVDTIVFGREKERAHILSMAERKSRYCCLALLKNVKRETVMRAFTCFFGDGKLPLETMTADQGVEFGCNQEFEAAFGKCFYFTRPHSPWQKPTVENMNGLIRQFFPHGIHPHELDPEDIQRVMQLLNNRPRKCLDWKTPAEVLHFT